MIAAVAKLFRGSSGCASTHFSPFFWVCVLAVLTTLLRLAVASHLELFQDEALYWFIGTRAPLTFAPHPPGTPWLARLGVDLLGRTELGVRLGSLILGLFSIPLFYLLAQRLLAAPILAGWTTLAFALTPIYLAFGSICTPDMPQLFLWITLLYTTWRALEGEPRWWLAAGLTFGIGLYFKYILVLYLPALAFYLWWSGEWRRALESRFFWLGFGLGIALFLPVALVREAQTGWGALSYHLRDRQRWDFALAKNAAVYMGVHAAYYSPLLFVAAVAGLGVVARQAWRLRERRLIFLAVFGALPWLFFATIALVTRRELSREQWDAPAYVCGLMAAAWFMRQRFITAENVRSRVSLRRQTVLAMALGALTISFVVVEALTNIPSAMLGRRPLFSATVGWRTLAVHLDGALRLARAEHPTVILANSFIPALQYNFYSELNPEIYTLDHSENRRYGLSGLFERLGITPRGLVQRAGVDALFVAEDSPKGRTEEADRALRKRLLTYFEAVGDIKNIDIPAGGHPFRRFVIVHCRRWYYRASEQPSSPPADE